jgi:hypothetical protein
MNTAVRTRYTPEQERGLSEKSRLILAALRDTTHHRRGWFFPEPFLEALSVTIGEVHDPAPENEIWRDYLYVWIYLTKGGGLVMGMDNFAGTFEETLVKLMQDANVNYVVPPLEEYRLVGDEVVRTPGQPDTRSNSEMAELGSKRLRAEEDEAAEDSQRWADDGGPS